MSNANIESMLFKYGTTYAADYRCGEIKDIVRTTYKAKPTCMRIRPRRLKDMYTLSDWKEGPEVPFNLLHKPKDVVGTNPAQVQKHFGKPIDTEFEEVKRTRPRVVITPMGPIDDVEDSRRALLCDEMYTTSAVRASRGVNLPYLSVKAPLPDLPAQANPVALRKLQPPFVSPEWKMDSVSWDSKQLRGYCPQTRLFWQRRGISRCDKCEESAAVVNLRSVQPQAMKFS